ETDAAPARRRTDPFKRRARSLSRGLAGAHAEGAAGPKLGAPRAPARSASRSRCEAFSKALIQATDKDSACIRTSLGSPHPSSPFRIVDIMLFVIENINALVNVYVNDLGRLSHHGLSACRTTRKNQRTRGNHRARRR